MDVKNIDELTTFEMANNSEDWTLPGLEQNQMNLSVALPVIMILLVLIVTIVLGNILVIMSVTLDRKLKKSVQNSFLLSLAVADLLVGVLIIPLAALQLIIGYWPFGQIFCDIFLSLDVLACTASILSLCAISIDRYKLVTDPIAYKNWRTKKKASFIIGTVWCISAIISIPPLLGWKEKKQGDSYHLELPQCNVNQMIGYILYSTILSFFLPAIVIVTLYVLILKVARERAKSNITKFKRQQPNYSIYSEFTSTASTMVSFKNSNHNQGHNHSPDSNRPTTTSSNSSQNHKADADQPADLKEVSLQLSTPAKNDERIGNTEKQKKKTSSKEKKTSFTNFRFNYFFIFIVLAPILCVLYHFRLVQSVYSSGTILNFYVDWLRKQRAQSSHL